MTEGILQREIEINAPIDAVWPLVSTSGGLSQWWGNEITLEPQVGGRCTERVQVHGTEIVYHGVVSIYAPPHELTLTFLPAQNSPVDIPDVWSAPSCVVITLEEIAVGTRVAIVHQVFSAVRSTAMAQGGASPRLGPQMALPFDAVPMQSEPPVVMRTGLLTSHTLQDRWETRLRRFVIVASPVDVKEIYHA